MIIEWGTLFLGFVIGCLTTLMIITVTVSLKVDKEIRKKEGKRNEDHI